MVARIVLYYPRRWIGSSGESRKICEDLSVSNLAMYMSKLQLNQHKSLLQPRKDQCYMLHVTSSPKVA